MCDSGDMSRCVTAIACHCACDGGAGGPIQISVCELCVDCIISNS